jgi:predicted nucleotidyltransferase
MNTTSVRLAEKHSAIVAACEENDVKRLDLFGSRARGQASDTSDADFLVEFNDPLRAGVFDRFLALRNALESILECDVDLVECSSIENPVLRKRIDEDRKTVYAA